MILNPKTDRPASYTKQAGDLTIDIVRLVEDEKIKKNIRFDEISIKDLADPADPQGGNIMKDEFGITYPIIRINDMIIPRFNISHMTISSKGFMPTISLSLRFIDRTFINKNAPKDGDLISIYIRTNTDALAYLRNEFIITKCSVTNGNNGNTECSVTLGGRMFIPGFDSRQSSVAYTGTSKQVLKDIAKEYEIGFSFNDFDDTDDYQTWIKHKQSSENFITEMISHAWKNETSFFKCWVDLYYNICFVNVNKFLLSTENQEVSDITFSTNTLDLYNITKNDTTIENAKLSIKALSNGSDFKDSPFYIRHWEPSNKSVSVSFRNGYTTTTHTFTHNQNYLNDNQQQCFQSLKNIPAYDQTKTDSYIILRGRSTYDKNKNPKDEKARINYDFVNTYNTEEWTGVEYTMHETDKDKKKNEWTGNVHKNYTRAPYHNTQNINELNKLYIKVDCDGLNLQIMRGERIPVYLIFNGEHEENSYNTFSENDANFQMNRFYSGFYIVDSVEITYNPNRRTGNITTPYTTTYILKRREWPTPEAI